MKKAFLLSFIVLVCCSKDINIMEECKYIENEPMRLDIEINNEKPPLYFSKEFNAIVKEISTEYIKLEDIASGDIYKLYYSSSFSSLLPLEVNKNYRIYYKIEYCFNSNEYFTNVIKIHNDSGLIFILATNPNPLEGELLNDSGIIIEQSDSDCPAEEGLKNVPIEFHCQNAERNNRLVLFNSQEGEFQCSVKSEEDKIYNKIDYYAKVNISKRIALKKSEELPTDYCYFEQSFYIIKR